MEAPSESCQHVAEPSSVGKLGWNVVGRLLPGASFSEAFALG